MKVKELIDQFCEFKGKCTTDDVVALNFAYEMLAPRWINVEDELPPKNEAYLAFWQHLGVTKYRYVKAGTKVSRFFSAHITHWMPLPQPPVVEVRTIYDVMADESYAIATEDEEGGENG
jgi:hypothetical protein